MRFNPLAWEIIFLILLSLMLLSSPFLEVLMITRYFILFASYLFIYFNRKQAYSLKWIKSTSEGWEILSKFAKYDKNQMWRNLLQYTSKGYRERQYIKNNSTFLGVISFCILQDANYCGPPFFLKICIWDL